MIAAPDPSRVASVDDKPTTGRLPYHWDELWLLIREQAACPGIRKDSPLSCKRSVNSQQNRASIAQRTTQSLMDMLLSKFVLRYNHSSWATTEPVLRLGSWQCGTLPGSPPRNHMTHLRPTLCGHVLAVQFYSVLRAESTFGTTAVTGFGCCRTYDHDSYAATRM